MMNRKMWAGIIIGIVGLILIGVGIFMIVKSHSNIELENNVGGNKMEGKVLVAYYSATGNTRNVAEKVANYLGADVFEVVPQEVYTEEDLDWTDDGSRVGREHLDESLREVALVQVTPEKWNEYDTVLIGYPIWWGIAAWPVEGFVKGNDFDGKTVIPFCTSASSGLGQSGELLARVANGGRWQTGQRFSSSVTDAEIKSWTDELQILD